VSSRLSVVAEPEDASLAGPPDGPGGKDGPVVALGAAAAADTLPAVRWLDRAPSADDPPAERLMGPVGDGLWRVAPWPAADALFELDSAVGDRCLVAGADAEAREALAERAAVRGAPIEQVEQLDAARLAEVACVVFADSPGGALPARAFAVLAARRLLILPRLETGFGLEDGLDHVEFASPDEAVTLIDAYRRAPEAFARVTTWGRLKAEPQRASVVYGRLADDLRLLGPDRAA
jgi:hypothetical protein